MLASDILTILIRDLNKLEEEISSYRNPEDIWKVLPGTSNSAGNLALHLAGNLRHFIGSVLGNSGYIRDRDLEFSAKNISIEEIKMIIVSCRHEVTLALTDFDSSRLQNEFPKEVGGQIKDVAYILLHLTSHLSYHLGQINYHRRNFSA